jgi:hypothetical protein
MPTVAARTVTELTIRQVLIPGTMTPNSDNQINPGVAIEIEAGFSIPPHMVINHG